MRYCEYIKLFENKDRFIDKNEVLTDKEKEFYKKFFKEHPEQEGKIKNWNFKITKEDFDKVIYDYDNNSGKLPKEKLSDLVQGEDYEYLGKLDGYSLYFIYTHKASYTIASNNVGLPVWSKLPYWYEKDNSKNDYIYDRFTDTYSGAKWCTAMHHTDYYFVKYFKEQDTCFIYGVSDSADTPAEKIAIALDFYDLDIYDLYDSHDGYYGQNDTFSTFQKFVYNNTETLKNCVTKLFDYFEKTYDIYKREEKFTVTEALTDAFNAIKNNDELPEYVESLLSTDNINIVNLISEDVALEHITYLPRERAVILCRDTIKTVIQLLGNAYFSTNNKYEILCSLLEDNNIGFSNGNTSSRQTSFVMSSFTTNKQYYLTGEHYESMSLLDMYSCIIGYFTKHYGASAYRYQFIRSTDDETKQLYKDINKEINSLFNNTESMTDELVSYIESYKNDLKTCCENTWNNEALYNVLETSACDKTQSTLSVLQLSDISKSEILLALILLFVRMGKLTNENDGVRLCRDSLSIVSYNNMVSERLHGFFAGVAKIFLEHINLNLSTVNMWFNILSSVDKQTKTYGETMIFGESPTAALIYVSDGYYFNRCLLDEALLVNPKNKYVI